MQLSAERGARGAGRSAGAGDGPKKKVQFKKALPEVWKLVRPRRWLLLGGLVLVAVNRASGLVLPLSTKYFIDQIIGRHRGDRLPLLAAIVFISFTTLL